MIVSMTWPQYLRKECSYKGFVTKLTSMEAEVLSTLLMRGPMPTPMALLVSILYGDCPEGGPEWAAGNVAKFLHRLRAKLPGAIRGRLGWGWYVGPDTGNIPLRT